MPFEEWVKMKEEEFTREYGVSSDSNILGEAIDFLGCNPMLNYMV